MKVAASSAYRSKPDRRAYMLARYPEQRKGVLYGYVYRRDDETCRYCGFPAECIDHVIPVAHGGDSKPDNTVAACNRCNDIAKDRMFASFDDKRDYILSVRRPEILAAA